MAPTRSPVAAGGVVWRGSHGSAEIAVVHRPRYDDWSLPKGKLNAEESALAAAVREVGEEVGATVAVTRRLKSVTYRVERAPKSVSFWAMRYVHGAFRPTAEVDEMSWLPVAEARELLTYSTDRAVLREFTSVPAPDSVVMLVRHARAGKRRDWRGDDVRRPLDEVGIRQSLHLADSLRHFQPDHVIAAEPLRCVQTVEPLAALFGLTVVVDPVFGDRSYERSPSASQTALLALAKPGRTSVVCSQGVTIPSLVDSLGPAVKHSDTRKGAVWVLSMVDGDVVAADYYEADPPR